MMRAGAKKNCGAAKFCRIFDILPRVEIAWLRSSSSVLIIHFRLNKLSIKLNGSCCSMFLEKKV